MKTIAIVTVASLSFFNFALAEQDKGSRGGHLSEEKKAELLAQFDKDGDNKLDKEERKAARDHMKAKLIEKFDADEDGKLSDVEKEAVRDAHFDKMFAEADTDDNGVISKEEMKAALIKKFGGKKCKDGKCKGKKGKKKGEKTE